MPVNMDPAKKRRRKPAQTESNLAQAEAEWKQRAHFGEDTDEDRNKALADAESRNLWDATEVIDMDKF